MHRETLAATIFWGTLIALVLAIYLPGLGNELIFDDARLSDGTIFERYGSLLEFRQRMLSYGSFVWVEALFGEGWWKQRLVNVVLHLGVAGALYVMFRQLLGIAARRADDSTGGLDASGQAALRVGVTLFAVNPVAVYAVAYLVQRSILMAALFSVLACVAFLRGLDAGRRVWLAVACVLYLCAVMSKEHAFMIAAMSVPLYVFARGANGRTLAWIGAGGAVMLLVGTSILLHFYGDLVGRAFDTASRIYVDQIDALSPGAADKVWMLSILNQTELFFRYGFLWFVPNIQWMSVDLRPAFPLSLFSFPEVLAALAWVALLAASCFAVLRRPGALGLLGLCMLFPLLLFVTEFATVWIQDPFVLYRSYLWAIAIPGIVAVLFAGMRPYTLYLAGTVIAVVFAGLALERNLSLSTAYRAWHDAAEKVNLRADASAVGRWRPFLNRGSYFLEFSMYEQASADFSRAVQLGEGEGAASFNLGVSLQQRGRHEEALDAFDAASSLGFNKAALHYHRAESLYELGRFDVAMRAFSRALRRPQDAVAAAQTRLRRAEAAVAARRFELAARDFELLLADSPDDPRLRTGLGMAYIGLQQGSEALEIFDALIAQKDAHGLRYGRAMALALLGERASALEEIERALRDQPDNPVYLQLRQQLSAGAR
jgi:tetratricopeptide (TPR) repeat protein